MVGFEYLIGAVALVGGALAHTFEVNSLDGVDDPALYLKSLPGYDRFLAKWTQHQAVAATMVGSFVATILCLSIHGAGPWLAMALGGAFVYDTLKVKKLKKSMKKG
jgi:hypothetical protein